MSTWKEKGVVLDSDDDDLEDSQSVGSKGGASDEDDGKHMNSDALQVRGRDDARRDTKTKLSPGRPQDKEQDMRLPTINDSPSSSPEGFKLPPMVNVEDSREQNFPRDQTPEGITDEISTSYIALSSPLSSLEDSQSENLSVNEDIASRNADVVADHGTDQREDGLAAENAEDITMEDLPDYYFMGRRSLRQRNPIQLRPYALEGEKYRRTLMARGMKPLRLAQVQEDLRQATGLEGSPDPDFESQDSSQNITFDQELPSSSAPSSQLSAPDIMSNFPKLLETRDVTVEDEEDEEFPDIEDLINKASTNFIGHRSKRRKVTYSTRLGQRLPPLTTAIPHEESRGRPAAKSDIFDVPASPPTTSSPFPRALGARAPRSMKDHWSAQGSSREPSLERNDTRGRTPVGILPTPATSAVKDTVDLTAIESETEDPMASDTESELEAPATNPDRSLQIRRVGKKIRGVLPASWLRLDAKSTRQVKEPQPSRIRSSQSLSPVKVHHLARKGLARKGLALPKVVSGNAYTEKQLPNLTPYFISDADSDDSELFELKDQSSDDDSRPNVDGDDEMLYLETDTMVEEDFIDAMLPGRKRQTKFFPTPFRKKGPTPKSLFQHAQDGPRRQPMITEHLSSTFPKTSRPSGQTKQHGQKRATQPKRTKQSKHGRSRKAFKPAPPKLSILDVIDPVDSREKLPPFIRIAARNARSRKGLGRHSPTRKYIRLGDQEDTEDAQNILRRWKEGTIGPRDGARSSKPAVLARAPLNLISSNDQNRVHPSSITERKGVAGLSRPSRKLLITRPRQTRLDWTQGSRMPAVDSSFPNGVSIDNKIKYSTTRKVVRSSHAHTLYARQAQLETSAMEQTIRHPSVAFGSTKKALDAVYWKGHRGKRIRGDIQLARFLAGDTILPQGPPMNEENNDEGPGPVGKTIQPAKAVRHGKHAPKRLDTGAAKYRQPSELLIPDSLQLALNTSQLGDADGKLAGLGTYGSTYTYHFDVFPLPSGVFFHETTFIGSGRLSKALNMHCAPQPGLAGRGNTVYTLAGKQLRWGLWDDVVASEMGLSFDWAIEQLDGCSLPGLRSSEDDVLGFLNFTIDYIGDYLCFGDEESQLKSMSRFMTLLNGINDRLDSIATNIDSGNKRKCRLAVETAASVVVIVFQLLKGFCSDNSDTLLKDQFENLLQQAAVILIKLLFVVGLGCVRKFYDDLQYLAVREQGIKPTSFAVQSWVILIHVLNAAHLPRASFWDLVNTHEQLDEVSACNDARLFERLWYSMFSLLPLCEFDQSGIVVSESRHVKSFENWTLPQRIFKRVFELYSSNFRQAPSFNQYCRTLFHRCHYLIEAWGWCKHGTIIGTLFDFFALHKLAHLRNEEAYKSPHFLEQLDQNPDLTVNHDDHCFHIFLKIVALSLAQLRKADNTKAIRNLVARVIPNHDRQYPKEKTIHQRDLASLRNHHDLLSTLFWAAPPDIRPSINLIRSLVEPSRCHREAYLIHLSTWSNLSAFALSRNTLQNSYKPFAEWEHHLFSQLVEQYESVDMDVEAQLRRLSSTGKSAISQVYVQQVAQRNKHAAIMLQSEHISALVDRLNRASTMNAIMTIFQQLFERFAQVTLSEGFSEELGDTFALQATVVETMTSSVVFYLSKLESLLPCASLPEDEEEDSQGYGVAAPVEYLKRLEYEAVIDDSVLRRCSEAIRCHTRNRYIHSQESSLQGKILANWIQIVHDLCASSRRYTFSDFGPGGRFAVFDIKDGSRIMRQWTMTYQLRFIKMYEQSTVDILTTGQDAIFGALYLLCLPKTGHLNHRGHQLLEHYLISDAIFIGLRNQYIRPLPKNNNRSQAANWNWAEWERTSELSSIKKYDDFDLRLQFIGEIFRKMSLELSETSPANVLSLRNRFRDIIEELQTAMRREAVDFPTASEGSSAFNNFIWSISKLMEIHFEFASAASTHFPHSLDPIYVDDAIEFKLRVYGERATTPRGCQELNFFCLALVKSMAPHPNHDCLAKKLLMAMQPDGAATHVTDSYIMQVNQSPLEKHFLTELVPSFVHVAFVNNKGFYPAQSFLNAAAEQLHWIANRGDEGLALRYALPVLRTITNGLGSLVRRHVDLNEEQAVPRSTQRLLSIIAWFYSRTFTLLWLLAQRDTGYKEEVLAHLKLFKEFAQSADLYFRNRNHNCYYLATKAMLSPHPNQSRIIDTYCGFSWQCLRHATIAYRQAFNAVASIYVDTTDEEATKTFHELLQHEHGGMLYRHFFTVLENMTPEVNDCFTNTEWIPKCVPFAVNILDDMEKNWRWDTPRRWSSQEPDSASGLEVRQGQAWVMAWIPIDPILYHDYKSSITSSCKHLLSQYDHLTVTEPCETAAALKNNMMRTLGATQKAGRVRAVGDYKPRRQGVRGKCLARFFDEKRAFQHVFDDFTANQEGFE